MGTGSIQIGIWLLDRSNRILPNEYSKVVVAAASEEEARQIANQSAGTEGYVWNDGSTVNSQFLGDAADGVYGLILASKD